jgi:hypothetical protein
MSVSHIQTQITSSYLTGEMKQQQQRHNEAFTSHAREEKILTPNEN